SALWTSPDGGARWRKSADLPGRARWMWIDPRSSKADRTVYVAGPDAMYRRQAGGWRTGASPGVFTDVTGTPPRFYATSAGKIFVSADGGMTWSASSLWGFWGRATAIAASPQQPDVAYVSYSGLRAPIRATFGVAKTVDGGRHWTPVWHNVRDAWLSERFNAGWAGNPVGLGVAPGTPDVVYATDYGRTLRTLDGGVVRSDDGGDTWRVQNTGMPQTAATHILRDPGGTLYVTGFGRGVFKSTDGGERWALKNAGIEGAQPLAWRLARDTKGTLYLVVARRSDDGSFANAGDGALYRSTDGAEHWTRIPLPRGVNGPSGLAIDP